MTTILKDSIVQIGHGCPSDWDCETTDGVSLYIRLRHGGFSISHNNNLHDYIHYSEPDGFNGMMETYEMIKYVNDEVKDFEIKANV